VGDGVSGRVLLRAEDLAYAHPGGADPGGVRAVEAASLELCAGELAFLIGPNGSGKSTLLRLCAGLLRPDRGRVTLEGRDLADLSDRERARAVGFLPQGLAVLPDLGVREFVLAGRYAHVADYAALSRVDLAAVDEALARCDVAELAERNLYELSGGQRQRVFVARALAQEARLLLVDEPTNALDPEHQLAVFELLVELARGERGVLVVTHDLVLAGQYARRVLVLDRGRLVAQGAPQTILRGRALEPVYGRQLSEAVFEDDPRGTRLVLPRRPGG